MSITDYLVDSALVLLVLLQIKERPLTTRSLIRPLVIVAIAVVSYFKSIPTAGNDLVLIGVLALLGAMLGTAAGQTTLVRRREDGVVVARAGWLAGFFWVLGMDRRAARDGGVRGPRALGTALPPPQPGSRRSAERRRARVSSSHPPTFVPEPAAPGGFRLCVRTRNVQPTR
jgi:hypothetical protein